MHKTWKKWTEEEKNLVRELYPKTSSKVIAEALERTPESIRQMAKVLGVRKSIQTLREFGRYRKKPLPLRDELTRLYWNEEKSLNEIAEAFGVSQITVLRWMNQYSIPRRRPRPIHRLKTTEDTKLLRGEATDFDMGFIVALIEGEGSVGITKRGEHSLTPYIQIANTVHEILEAAQQVIGGNINDSGNECYYLAIYGLKTLSETLRRLIPFLISKKERAILVLEFCESRIKHENMPYTQREIAIYKEVRRLNE